MKIIYLLWIALDEETIGNEVAKVKIVQVYPVFLFNMLYFLCVEQVTVTSPSYM